MLKTPTKSHIAANIVLKNTATESILNATSTPRAKLATVNSPPLSAKPAIRVKTSVDKNVINTYLSLAFLSEICNLIIARPARTGKNIGNVIIIY